MRDGWVPLAPPRTKGNRKFGCLTHRPCIESPTRQLDTQLSKDGHIQSACRTRWITFAQPVDSVCCSSNCVQPLNSEILNRRCLVEHLTSSTARPMPPAANIRRRINTPNPIAAATADPRARFARAMPIVKHARLQSARRLKRRRLRKPRWKTLLRTRETSWRKFATVSTPGWPRFANRDRLVTSSGALVRSIFQNRPRNCCNSTGV